ncbi:Hypothetical predicted protein [Lecanosticta acicola]|uniref:Sulfotransferase n=1 Tax=Lecanosticta acicola TaxID=111012 RepID=A0AAI9E7L4_9PEZI|nr:Hypothetical predicted protein [Lecanosticta acicola]
MDEPDDQGRLSSQHCMGGDGRPSYTTESVLTAVEDRELEPGEQQEDGTSHRWRTRNRNKNPKGLLHRFAKLGYRPYHGLELVKNGKRDMDLLHEALTLKHNCSEHAYGQLEFDQIWGKYDALIDLPAYAFVPELLKHYPQTLKFILTDRHVDVWHAEMQKSVFAHLDCRSLLLQSFYDSHHARPLRRLMRKWAHMFCGLDFGGGARRAYVEHVRYCLKAVPKERLLILKFEEDGEDWWEDLCTFLGHEVPREVFPRVDTVEAFDQVEEISRGNPELAAMQIILAAIVVAAVAAVWWCHVMRL